MNLIKKISIVLLCLMTFSFYAPRKVKAEDGLGGKLLNPVMSLVTALGDGAMSIAQKQILGIDNSFIELNTKVKDGSKWSAVKNWLSKNWRYLLAGALAIAAVAVNFIPVAGQVAGAGLAIVAEVLLGSAIVAVGYQAYLNVNSGMLPNTLVLPTYEITPKEIFSNEIPLIDVDFFNPADSKTVEYVDDDGNKQSIELYSTSGKLQETVSKWYQILRDIAIVASMSILVYIGIRILISSTSNDKAKYKQMIVDWLVALCLLFIMQYIMSFSNLIVNKITDMVSSIKTHDYKPSDFNYSDDYEISVEEGFQIYTITDETTVYNAYKKFVESWAEENGKEQSEAPMYSYFTFENNQPVSFYWPTNNEMEQTRVNAQLLYDEKETWESIGYKIVYCVLVIFTFIFLFTYIKRVLYITFLTIIAPLVAMTYPIDKINDGKAQAFDMWLKEYIFNLLIQPMHLILYTILIGSAMDLAANNVIYVVCALGFMIPAEKLMRRFFGFEKAQTPGMLAGPAGAAMMMSGMQKILGKGPHGGHKDHGNGGSSNKEKEDGKPPRMKDTDFNAADQLTDGIDKNVDEKPDGNIEEERPKEIPEEDANDDQLALQEAMDAYRNGDIESEGEYLYSGDRTEDEKALQEAMSAYRNGDIESGSEYEYSKDQQEALEQQRQQQLQQQQQQQQQQQLQQQQQQTRLQPQKPELNRRQRLGRAISRTGKMYARGMANKISNRVKDAHVGRKLLRMAGGAAVGATAATIGLTAGIASGDPSKAFQYTTAGAAVGYKAGSGIGDKVANAPKALSVEGTADKFKEEYYGKQEYLEKQIQKAVKEKQKDLELRFKLEDKLGSKEKAKQYMESELPEIVRYGDFDNKTIVAMAQMKEKDNISTKDAIAAAMMSEQYLDNKNYNNIGGKASEDFEKTLNKRAAERNLKGQGLEKFKDKTKGTLSKLDQYRFD